MIILSKVLKSKVVPLDRFEDMRIIQDEIVNKLLHKLERYTNQINKAILNVLRKKLETVNVRLYFSRKIYDYILEAAIDENIKLRKVPKEILEIYLPFIVEVLMVLMYHDNAILDNKRTVNENHNKRSQTLLGKNLLLKTLKNLLREDLPKEYSSIIIEFIEEPLYYTDLGQFLDQFTNKYDVYKDPKLLNIWNEQGEIINKEIDNIVDLSSVRPIIDKIKAEIPNKAKFIEMYFIRMYLIGSSLFELTTKIIMRLLGYKGKQKENIIRYSQVYGITLQIINDTCDFVEDGSTAGKDTSDICNDLKNSVITLPLIFHLNSTKGGYITKYLNYKYKSKARFDVQKFEHELIEVNKYNIFKEIIKSKGLFKSMKIGAKLARIGRSYLNSNYTSAFYLDDMFNLAGNNRYYTHILRARIAYQNDKQYSFDKNYYISNKNSINKNKSSILC